MRGSPTTQERQGVLRTDTTCLNQEEAEDYASKYYEDKEDKKKKKELNDDIPLIRFLCQT